MEAKEPNLKSLGSLMPSISELAYLRSQTVESMMLQGRIGKLYQVDHLKWKNTDADYIYKEPVEISYTLDLNPSVNLLSRYGWLGDGNVEQPQAIIAYCTFTDIEGKEVKLEEGCLLDIISYINVGGEENVNKFFINGVATDLELNQAVLRMIFYRPELKEGVRQLPVNSDPELEHKYTKREETWIPEIEG